MVAPILFFVLATVAIAAGLGCIISRNPVTSALWLILNLFCIAGIYLTLNAQFIAVIQVLVYAGAIMVLFLFVIMLLNLAALPQLQDFDWRKGLGFILAMGVLGQFTYLVAQGLGVVPETVLPEATVLNGSPETLGLVLFTEYLLPFEVIGVLLLVATIGAVLIAARRVV